MTGIVASTTANVMAGSDSKSWTPSDFMPSNWRKTKQSPKRKRLTAKEKRAINEQIRDHFSTLVKAQEIRKQQDALIQAEANALRNVS